MNILEEATEIISGDREQTYGRPGVNLERIATLWEEYIKQKYGVWAASGEFVGMTTFVITPEDVCWMMVLLKMARQMNAGKRDNLVDAAGYIALIEKIAPES